MSLRLFESVRKGEVENLRCLLGCGGNVLVKDSNDSNLLHIAVISKQVACAELLIQQAPQLASEKNSWGRTPLICACTPVVSLEMIKVLVGEKASLEIADDDCCHTPLHFVAADCEGLEATKLLLDCGANINAVDRKFMSVLQLAIRNGNLDTVKLLLDRGATVCDKDFMEVDMRHFWSILQILLQHKPSGINAKNYNGYTLLMQIAKFGDVDQVQELLRLGADCNAISAVGKTALMEAVESGDPKVVQILLKGGANPLVEDCKGRTILSLACKCDYYAGDMLNLVFDVKEFKNPHFQFSSSEVHPQTIILRKKRSPNLLKLIVKSDYKDVNLIVNEDFMNINLFKIFDSHDMALGPISYLLNNPESSEATDSTSFKLLEILLHANYPVNTYPNSVPPLTILFSWDINDIEDIDEFMKFAYCLIQHGACVNDMSLRIVTTKDEWPIVENLRQETMLPDALLMAYLSRNLPAIKLMLPHWSAPPLLLLLLDKEIQAFEINKLYETLAVYGLPLGTELCRRLSEFLQNKCNSLTGGKHECFNAHFQNMLCDPPSLKVLAKYAVRSSFAHHGANLIQQLQAVCPPGLKTFLLMMEDSSSTDNYEDDVISIASTSSTPKVTSKRRKM